MPTSDAADGNEPDDSPDDDVRTITVCPECSSPDIWLRRPGRGGGSLPDDAPRYYCSECKARFDYPDEIETEIPHTTSGLSHRLDNADPDALPDGGGVRDE